MGVLSGDVAAEEATRMAKFETTPEGLRADRVEKVTVTRPRRSNAVRRARMNETVTETAWRVLTEDGRSITIKTTRKAALAALAEWNDR